jgi:hypothetical protein
LYEPSHVRIAWSKSTPSPPSNAERLQVLEHHRSVRRHAGGPGHVLIVAITISERIRLHLGGLRWIEPRSTS